MPGTEDGPDGFEQVREDVRQVAEYFSRILTALREFGTVPPITPTEAHERREQADQERDAFAWLHQCGHLNRGYWHKQSMCGGCRFSVERAGEVEAHYRLVPVEGLDDEEQA